DTISTNFSYKYIARMDSDDIAIKNRLMFQADFLDKNPHIDVCGSYCHEFGSNFSLNEKKLPISHDEILNFSIYRCPLIHPCVMFRSEIFKSGYRYPTDTNLTEDMALWFLLLESGFKFHNIPIVLLNYRLSEDTINRRKGISKAISEIRVRLYYMSKLKKTSIKNIILILSRLPFHLLPSFIIKFFYKNFRQ
ncbi:glycosyl transferase, partial [Morganella morganii]